LGAFQVSNATCAGDHGDYVITPAKIETPNPLYSRDTQFAASILQALVSRQAPAGSLPLPSTPKLHPTTNATLCESHAPTLYTSQAITCSNPLFMWRLVSNSTNTTDVGPTANVNTTATTTLPRPYLALWHNASSAFSANSNRAVFQAPEWTCRNVTVDHGVEVGAGIEVCPFLSSFSLAHPNHLSL